MRYAELKHAHQLATVAEITGVDGICRLTSGRAGAEGTVQLSIPVDGPAQVEEHGIYLPLPFFSRVMHAYVSVNGDIATIERGGRTAYGLLHPEGPGYVPAEPILDTLGVDFSMDCAQAVVRLIVEVPKAGPRSLSAAELALPYSKYYTQYWAEPFHLRADVRAWGEKAYLYQLGSRRNPAEMLHIRDTRRLLDPAYRAQQWTEGWTLFPDGTGVMCTKTEFPGTNSSMFQWWFAWHVKEDLRYMLWFPPAHFGIAPTLEYREKLNNSGLDLYEKTHGGDATHLVYESTPIDALSYQSAAATSWHPISFQDITARSFLESDRAELERQGCVAICGGTRMLHFFADRTDGTGGTLYSHFWYGAVPDGAGGWTGPGGGEDPTLIQPILNIGQHAVKEFARLADILPQLYREEGTKPIDGR